MNDPHPALIEVEALRQEEPERALGRLGRASSMLMARPEARLVEAELVHQLRGPAAARTLLLGLLATFPEYGSAYHLLGRVAGELGDERAKIESYLMVHSLDRVLDDALEERDVAELEHALTRTAVDSLAAAPSWLRARLAPVPLRWRGRPRRAQVQQGFDPRALAMLEALPDAPTAGRRCSSLRLVLYRTNLLASSDDEFGLRANLRASVLDAVAHTG